MTRNELIKRYPRASESFIRANLSSSDSGSAAKLEPNSSYAPLGAKKIQRQSGSRLLMRVTSVRKRLIDEDNLCSKFFGDLCRYAGIIPDDTPEQLKIEVCQRKAIKGEEEHTVIEILEITKEQ